MEALERIRETIRDLDARAGKARRHAAEKLAPLFREGHGKPPGDFVDSSYLYIGSCPADQGFRPLPCPVFWTSTDIAAVPLTNLGAPTTTLSAGEAYRLTATVRNRGDLAVPAAKVEFFLTDPTLGFDTRFARRLGVGQGRVEAHGAAQIAIDWLVPPDLQGHHCLFARVFSFAPLDIPVSDTGLDPRIDRHVAQLNLNFIGSGAKLIVNWVHHRNARQEVLLQPVETTQLWGLHHPALALLRPVSPRIAAEYAGQVRMELEPAREDGVQVIADQTHEGMVLVSEDPGAASIDEQQEQEKLALGLLADGGGMGVAERRKFWAGYRRVTQQMVLSRLVLRLPRVPLREGEAVGFNLVRRDQGRREATGGVTIFLVP